VLDRQRFDEDGFVPGKPGTLKLTGAPQAAHANERGWKDTVIAYPGEVTRVIATFDLPGLYVWHCHILEHEDHEMMRPYRVVP
jgi:spore coat protein A